MAEQETLRYGTTVSNANARAKGERHGASSGPVAGSNRRSRIADGIGKRDPAGVLNSHFSPSEPAGEILRNAATKDLWLV